MGFLDRIRGRADSSDGDARAAGDGAAQGDAPGTPGPSGDDGVAAVEEIGIRHLSAEEEARLEAARAQYPAHGIDPADLTTIATAYDRALDRREGEDVAVVVEVLSTAIGDHLVTVGGYRWVVSTDPFGTDLAVEPPRRGVPVVTRMLVAVRWMSRDRGWVIGVTEHLARIGRS